MILLVCPSQRYFAQKIHHYSLWIRHRHIFYHFMQECNETATIMRRMNLYLCFLVFHLYTIVLASRGDVDINKLETYIDGRVFALINDHLHTIDGGMFSGMPQLKVISITNSSLQVVNKAAFVGLMSLEVLKLILGRLETPPPLMDIRITLVKLILNNNYITYVDSDYFMGCERLSTLDLNRNLLATVPNLEHVSFSIESLRLASNHLQGNIIAFNKDFPNLHLVYIGDNFITGYCTRQFEYTPKLSLLNLNNNRISHFDFKSIMNVDLLLLLTSNPLQCVATTSCGTPFSGTEGHTIQCGLSEIIFGTDCMNNTSRFQF